MATRQVKRKRRMNPKLKKILLISLAVLFVFSGIKGVMDKKKSEEQYQEIQKQYNPNDITVADYANSTTDEYLADYLAGLEENTNTIPNAIFGASERSSNFSRSEEKRNEALEFIINTYPNYFVDNQTMIKGMYYGSYLDHAYAEDGKIRPIADLGFDVWQACRDVYRGSETVESQFVQANLQQIQDGINEVR